MPYSRYTGRGTFINRDPKYRSAFFENRAVEQIEQYESPDINHPTQEQMDSLNNSSVRWDSASKLYNLAYDYYGDASYWWVIAWYNRKPTEAHFKVGDIVYVPLPLERVLEYF